MPRHRSSFIVIALVLFAGTPALAEPAARPGRAAVAAKLKEIEQRPAAQTLMYRMQGMRRDLALKVHDAGGGRALLLTGHGFQVGRLTSPLVRQRADKATPSLTTYRRYRVPLIQAFLRGEVLDTIATDSLEAEIDHLAALPTGEPLASVNPSAAEEKDNPWGYKRDGEVNSPYVLRTRFFGLRGFGRE